MKYAKQWHYGGNRKSDKHDYITSYIVENGRTINVHYEDIVSRYYTVGKEVFFSLKEAKKYLEYSKEE